MVHDHPVVACLAGGWLERWLWLETRALLAKEGEPLARAVARGVTLRRPEDNFCCEFDVAVLRNNQLYLAECKTRAANSAIDPDWLFKLVALAEGTEFAPKVLLLTSAKAGEWAEERAQTFRITVAGRDAGRAAIVHKLRRWLDLPESMP